MSSSIVCKFGGTSVATAEQLKKVKAIVDADSKRRFIVVSAPGKRDKEDQKITDLLYLAHETAVNQLDCGEILGLVKQRYDEILAGLSLDLDFSKEFAEIKEKMATESTEYAASRGEYLNGLLVAEYLKASYVDPADHILFNSEGHFDEEQSYDSLAKTLTSDGLYVISGFYGRGVKGEIKTFSRGGSDITGAIVARAVKAEVYENWTDVNGLLKADPRIVDQPEMIEKVSYMELRELSYMGAQVLHDEAIFPVRELGIPVHIRNTNNPSSSGTQIVADIGDRDNLIIGVAGRKDFESITISKALMNKEIGFGRKLLTIFENHCVSFEHLPSGIDTISVVVKSENIESCRDTVLEEIQTQLKVDSIQNFHNLAILAIVGAGMANHPGTAAKVLGALANSNINVRLIDQGASELNILIGVTNDDYEEALRQIYKALF